jgi:hypothetical protein
MKVKSRSELTVYEVELLELLQAKLDLKEWNQERFDQEYASCFPHPEELAERERKLTLNYFVTT